MILPTDLIHDIKNNLAVIQGGLNLLQKEQPVLFSEKRYLSNSLAACHHHQLLLDCLGSLIRLGSVDWRPELKPVDLFKIVETITGRLSAIDSANHFALNQRPAGCIIDADFKLLSTTIAGILDFLLHCSLSKHLEIECKAIENQRKCVTDISTDINQTDARIEILKNLDFKAITHSNYRPNGWYFLLLADLSSQALNGELRVDIVPGRLKFRLLLPCLDSIPAPAN